jgi:hypothetical protein
VKEDERGGQCHTSASLLHQSAAWHRAVNTHCFYTSAVSTSCLILSVTDDKIERRVYIRFCLNLRKSATRTLVILRDAFGERSLSWTTVFEWHSHFKVGRVLVEDDERSRRPSISKATENVDKFEDSTTKTVAKQSFSSQTPFGSVLEFARRS